MNLELCPPLHARLRSQVRHALESLDELRPAIRVTRVVQSVDAYEHVRTFEQFRPGQRVRKEYGIARRNVRNGYSAAHLISGARFRNFDIGRKSRAAELAQPYFHDSVFGRPEVGCDVPGGLQFDLMPLPVIERQRVAIEALAPGEGQARGRIEAAAQQADRFRMRFPGEHRFIPIVPGRASGRVLSIMRGLRIRFLTSTPLDVGRGSGTYVGIEALARALRAMGHVVELETPRHHLPIYTFERLAYNRGLQPRRSFDLTVGFDMDGYRIAGGNASHVAALKGVIADEVRFEAGLTRLTMAVQARCERVHAQRAARVIVPSAYSAERASELYGLTRVPHVVPEPIDIAEWRKLLEQNPAPSMRFTVLFVGRFYRRKRLDTLLRAAAALRARVPGIEFRIIGDGPHARHLTRLAQALELDGSVAWLGNVSRAELAAEYNRASLFCLPSEQEAFGIVLAEAMASGVPIVAARAAALPEVAPQAALFTPGDHGQLARQIEDLHHSPESREASRAAGLAHVRLYDAHLTAERFLMAAASEPATEAAV